MLSVKIGQPNEQLANAFQITHNAITLTALHTQQSKRQYTVQVNIVPPDDKISLENERKIQGFCSSCSQAQAVRIVAPSAHNNFRYRQRID